MIQIEIFTEIVRMEKTGVDYLPQMQDKLNTRLAIFQQDHNVINVVPQIEYIDMYIVANVCIVYTEKEREET